MFLTERPGIKEETGIMNEALSFSRAGCRGILSGTLDSGKGNAVNRMASTMVKIAKDSIAHRMVRGTLIEREAKVIEASAT